MDQFISYGHWTPCSAELLKDYPWIMKCVKYCGQLLHRILTSSSQWTKIWKISTTANASKGDFIIDNYKLPQIQKSTFLVPMYFTNCVHNTKNMWVCRARSQDLAFLKVCEKMFAKGVRELAPKPHDEMIKLLCPIS